MRLFSQSTGIFMEHKNKNYTLHFSRSEPHSVKISYFRVLRIWITRSAKSWRERNGTAAASLGAALRMAMKPVAMKTQMN